MHYAETKNFSMRARRNARAFPVALEMPTKMNWLFVAVLLFVAFLFILFYVVNINSLSLLGYRLTEQEEAAKKLAEENQFLKLQLVQLKSSEHLKKLAEDFEMLEIKNVNYAYFGPMPVAQASRYHP